MSLSHPGRLLALALVAAVCLPLAVTASAQAATGSRVSAAWSRTHLTVGDPAAVRGRVSPAHHPRTVALQRRTGRGWTTVARRRTQQGAFRLRLPAHRAGAFTYRVRVAASAAARAGTSGTRTVRVARRVARGNPRAFKFISKNTAKDPVARWNPCKPIGYRVNARLGGAGALADVRGALRRIRRVNGLRFVYRGTTRIVPGGRGSDNYPRDTQLVVSWARPAQSRYLDGSGVAGMGGPRWTYWTQDGRSQAMITSGFVVLNANLPLGRGFGGGVHGGYVGTRGQLLMHELGHAVGLDHPRQDDRWQIMYPTMTAKTAVWGRGDRRGLRALGAARGCLRPPSFARAGFSTAGSTAHLS